VRVGLLVRRYRRVAGWCLIRSQKKWPPAATMLAGYEMRPARSGQGQFLCLRGGTGASFLRGQKPSIAKVRRDLLNAIRAGAWRPLGAALAVGLPVLLFTAIGQIGPLCMVGIIAAISGHRCEAWQSGRRQVWGHRFWPTAGGEYSEQNSIPFRHDLDSTAAASAGRAPPAPCATPKQKRPVMASTVAVVIGGAGLDCVERIRWACGGSQPKRPAVDNRARGGNQRVEVITCGKGQRLCALPWSAIRSVRSPTAVVFAPPIHNDRLPTLAAGFSAAR